MKQSRTAFILVAKCMQGTKSSVWIFYTAVCQTQTTDGVYQNQWYRYINKYIVYLLTLKHINSEIGNNIIVITANIRKNTSLRDSFEYSEIEMYAKIVLCLSGCDININIIINLNILRVKL